MGFAPGARGQLGESWIIAETGEGGADELPRRSMTGKTASGSFTGFARGLGGWQLKCQVRSLPSVIAVLAIACGRPT